MLVHCDHCPAHACIHECRNRPFGAKRADTNSLLPALCLASRTAGRSLFEARLCMQLQILFLQEACRCCEFSIVVGFLGLLTGNLFGTGHL